MVPTYDGGHIPAIYRDFVEVLSETKAETLRPYWATNHAIDQEPGYNLPYGQIYNLSEIEWRTLKACIEANPANGIILWSSSLAAALILSAKKSYGEQRLCVNDRALNEATVKNRYPISSYS